MLLNISYSEVLSISASSVLSSSLGFAHLSVNIQANKQQIVFFWSRAEVFIGLISFHCRYLVKYPLVLWLLELGRVKVFRQASKLTGPRVLELVGLRQTSNKQLELGEWVQPPMAGYYLTCLRITSISILLLSCISG